MDHYYLVASLPPLALDRPPPLTPDAFRARCGELLPADAAAILDAALDDGALAEPHPHPLVGQRRAREVQVRNALARLRAARRGVEAGPHLRPHPGWDARSEAAVASAWGLGDPLARERALDALRWTLADELRADGPFSLGALIAYGVQLRLADADARRDPAAGERRLDHLAAVPLPAGSP